MQHEKGCRAVGAPGVPLAPGRRRGGPGLSSPRCARPSVRAEGEGSRISSPLRRVACPGAGGRVASAPMKQPSPARPQVARGAPRGRVLAGPPAAPQPGQVCLSGMKTTGAGGAGLQPGVRDVGDPFPEIK